MRDLHVRARQAAVRSLRQARQQLSGFLLRHGRITASDLPGRRRITALGCPAFKFNQPALLYSVGRCRRRCRSGNRASQPAGGGDRSHLARMVACCSGASTSSIAGHTSGGRPQHWWREVGDITRFTNQRQLMAYLGLVPSEHSSGSTRRQGGITKAGNRAARRMLIEAA